MKALEDRNEEQRLDEAMAALRREESRAETPARVEAAVMAAWETSGRLKAAPTYVASGFGRTLKPAAALAAGVVLTAALGYLGQELREAGVAPVATVGPRLLLVGEPILEGEAVRVVRMRMPASTLDRLGMRSTTGNVTAVDVDVIVGEDGVARAIRF